MNYESGHYPIPEQPIGNVNMRPLPPPSRNTVLGGDVKGWFVIVAIPFLLMGIGLLLAIASRLSN